MASSIAYSSALDGLLPGKRRSGKAQPEIEIVELAGLGQHQVRALKGQTSLLAKRLATHLGRKSPLSALEGASRGGLFIAATGPEEYWVITEKPASNSTSARIEKIFGTQACLFDQSHARCVVRISGTKSADLLAKGMPLDLSKPSLPRSWAAHTNLEHIPALIVKRGPANSFEVSFARSYAGSFTHWLLEAAREYETVIQG